MEKLRAVEREGLKTDIPAFAPGDTVRVMVRVREGEKERLQAFDPRPGIEVVAGQYHRHGRGSGRKGSGTNEPAGVAGGFMGCRSGWVTRAGRCP